MTDSRQLLAEYVAGSESAFRELVARYIDMVFSPRWFPHWERVR